MKRVDLFPGLTKISKKPINIPDLNPEQNLNLYKTLFENSKEGLVLTGKAGIIELVNSRFLELFGYSEEEVLGQPIEIVIPREKKETHIGTRSEYSKDPKTRNMGIGMYLYGEKKDGSKLPVEISLSHFKNEAGDLQVLALVTDVSTKKEIEDKMQKLNIELEKKVNIRTKEVQRSHALYSQIARNFPKGTINVFDENLNYVFVDGKELFNMGIDGASLVGSNYIKRLPNDISLTIQGRLLDVFKGESDCFEIDVANGVYELNAVPLKEEDGSISQILVVERNITEEKKIEEEIKKSLEREKELNELKSRFVAMASHEFRTPLSSVLSSASLLEKYTETGQQEKREKHINRIKSSVKNLTGILNDILTLSKVEEGRIEVIIEDVPVAEFCKELCEEVEAITDRGQKINFSHKGENRFNTDSKLLKNIVFNLLSNAVKYSYDNGKIDLICVVLPKELKLKVVDNGIGIPEAEQSKMFERFFRAANVTNIQGTGLGLNIVKKYVELLEGNITFTSIPEQGTEFTITIPL